MHNMKVHVGFQFAMNFVGYRNFGLIFCILDLPSSITSRSSRQARCHIFAEAHNLTFSHFSCKVKWTWHAPAIRVVPFRLVRALVFASGLKAASE